MITNAAAEKFRKRFLGSDPLEVFVLPNVYVLSTSGGRDAVQVGHYTKTIRAPELAGDANWAARESV